MEDERIIDGAWQCAHDGGRSTVLREQDRQPQPPGYVVCPDCGTHWVVWQWAAQRLARPAIVPVVER